MFFISLALLTIGCTIFLTLKVFDSYDVLVWFALVETRKEWDQLPYRILKIIITVILYLKYVRNAKYTADRWNYVYILCRAFGYFFWMKIYFLWLDFPINCWWWSGNALTEAQTLMYVL